jgi:hypothetical protein
MMTKLTLNIQLRALVEQAKAVGTGASTDQVRQRATEQSRVNVGGITGIGSFVTARELSLVTALGLSLLDGHVVGNREANVGVAFVADAIGVTNTASEGVHRRKGSDNGSETKDSSESELHYDGKELSERLGNAGISLKYDREEEKRRRLESVML